MTLRYWNSILALLLLLGSGSAKAIQFIGTDFDNFGGKPTDQLTFNTPQGTAAGDVMIAVITILNDPNDGGHNVITAPPGWTLIVDNPSTNTTGIHQALYYRVVVGAEPPSYKWTFTRKDRSSGGILTYRGVNTTDPIDAFSPGTLVTSGGSITAPSVTTTVAGDELIAFYGSDTGKGGMTPPAGMTLPTDVGGARFNQETGAGPNGISQMVANQTLGTAGATGDRVANGSGLNGSAVIGQLLALKPTALDHFIITLADGSPIPQQTAGQSFNIMITAVDVGGNTVAGFSGSVDLTSTGTLSAAGDSTPTFTAGVLNNYAVTISNTGTFTLTATQTGGDKTGTSNSFSVVAGPFARLQVLVQGETAVPGTATGKTGAPVSPDAGATFTVTVNAVDANWNIISAINDVVSLGSSDPVASIPPSAALTNGTKTFMVALNSAGTQNITASDATNATVTDGISSPIVVNAVAAGFNAFDPSTPAGATAGPLTTKVAGQAFNVDVIAIKNGGVDGNYNKTITMTLIVSNSTVPAPSGCPAGWTSLQSQPVSFTGGSPNRPRVTFVEDNAWRQARFMMTDGKTTSCSTNTFAIRPATLAKILVQDATRTTPGTVNTLNVTSATGAPIHNAGQPFRVTATALNALGAIADNYNGSPEPAALSLLQPTGCAACVSGTFTTGTWTAAGGTVVTTTATYSEAGSVSMQLVDRHFADIDINDSTAAQREVVSATFNVGRFVPDHFAVTRNIPRFTTGCAAGQFTYVAEPFKFSRAPVITVIAQNASNGTTKNYTASLFRLTSTSLTGRTYQDMAALATLDTAALPATTADPAVVDNGNGIATLTFSAGMGLDYVRSAPVQPFDSLIDLTINVQDLDSVTVTTIDGVPASNPVVFNDIAFDNGNEIRYGRAFVNSAVGSEFLNLPMIFVVQYYQNANNGFVTNTADSCTMISSVTLDTFIPYAGNTFALGDTSATLTSPAVGGGFGLSLSAPGANHQGTVDVTAEVPVWLQYDWNGDGAYDDNPSSRAAFGVYEGNPNRVYQYEVVGPP